MSESSSHKEDKVVLGTMTEAQIKRCIAVLVIGSVLVALFLYMTSGITDLYSYDTLPTGQNNG